LYLSEVKATHPDQDPRKGNRAGRIARGVGFVAGGAFLAVNQHNGVSPDEARKTIATQQFEAPHIISVKDEHHIVDGHDEVEIKLSLPTGPEAAAAMKQYQSADAAVQWLVPSHIVSGAVGKESNGKDGIVGHGFSDTIPALPFGQALNIEGDVATVTVYPNVSDPTSQRVALFADTLATTTHTESDGKKELVMTEGKEYIGTVEKYDNEWNVAMDPDQPPLPDKSQTWSEPL
jgi:hypothetical protein